jgi:flagellar assembly protein FliH
MSAESIVKAPATIERVVRSATLARTPQEARRPAWSSRVETTAEPGTAIASADSSVPQAEGSAELARRQQFERALAAEREAALKAARAEGLAQASEDVARFKDGMRNHLAGTFANIERAYQEQLRSSEATAIDIAFAALCRLVGETHADRSMITASVQTVLSGIPASSSGSIHVRTSDLPILQELMAHPDMSLWSGWRLVPDPSIRAGGCIVRTPRGDFDGRLEAQLDALATLLEPRRSGSGTHTEDADGSR